jgi:hypothetical protein
VSLTNVSDQKGNMMIINIRVFAISMIASLAVGSIAFADEISKEACVDSHSRGQDARDQGKLSLARKLFLTCAQSSCPTLIQGDCARFADDLTRLQSTVTFSARDSSGADLPDTTVYVDDVLIVTRLDDGKPHDIDPGKHTIRFSHDGKMQLVTVVVGTGEKGRAVSTTFPSAIAPVTSGVAAKATPGPKTTHPAGAKPLMIAGGVLAIGGTTLGIIGITRVPSNCSISTHQCAAPPGDPSFGKAGSAIQLTNIGFLAGGVGIAALVGGFIWYARGGKTTREEKLVAPWVTPNSAGIALTGRL